MSHPTAIKGRLTPDMQKERRDIMDKYGKQSVRGVLCVLRDTFPEESLDFLAEVTAKIFKELK